jgi:hypothetical protein
MENKQTAVEWLKDQIKCFGNKHELQMSWATLDELLEQAKQMDKEQKQNMFDCGRQFQLTGEGTFTEVYNETYGCQTN